MRSPALAIAWEVWARRRWLSIATLAGFAVLCLLTRLQTVLHPDIWKFVIGMSFGYSMLMFGYMFSVFVYADESRSGGFPSRMFVLPVRTSVLVAVPMLYGLLTVTLVWLLLAWLVWVPLGFKLYWWTLPLAAGSMACVQAASWILGASPIWRIILVIFAVPTVALGVAYVYAKFPSLGLALLSWGMMHESAVELCISIIYACFIPLAYLAAVIGVVRDRQGKGFNVAWARDIVATIARAWPMQRRRLMGQARPRTFSSAARAQLWFEWHGKGIILPGLVSCVVLYLVLMAGLGLKFDSQDLVLAAAAIVGLPLLLSCFLGFGLAKNSFFARDLRLSTFTATRPMSSDNLVAAKLKMAAFSTLAVWAVVIIGLPLLIISAGKFVEVEQFFTMLSDRFSRLEIIAMFLLGSCGALVLTWTLLVGGMTVSLTGRTWVEFGVAVAALFAIALLLMIGFSPMTERDIQALLVVVPIVLVLKLLFTLAALRASRRLGWWPLHSLSLVVGAWLMGAISFITLIYWFLPAEGGVISAGATARLPLYLITLSVILFMPLARPIAAPLALHWNRHR